MKNKEKAITKERARTGICLWSLPSSGKCDLRGSRGASFKGDVGQLAEVAVIALPPIHST